MCFRWSLFLSDKEKNKSGSRAYLSSKHKNVFLNFRLEFEQNILFGIRVVNYSVLWKFI